MTHKHGWMTEKPSSVAASSRYEAVVVATAQRMVGRKTVSACAHDLSTETPEILVEEGWPSEGADSSLERGYLGASIGAVDACGEESLLTILCPLENVVLGISGANELVNNRDMLDRLLKTAERKNIRLKPLRLKENDPKYEERRKRLMERARRERDKRVAELSE